MKLAGQEHALKARVPLKDGKRGLKLCDVIRGKLVDHAQAEDDALLKDLSDAWQEFVSIAFEKAEAVPPVDALDFYEVIESLTGFTQARSRTPESKP